MSLRFARLFASRSRSLGVWSDFKSRSSSLKLLDEKLQKDLFEGSTESGPASIADKSVRAGYHSPPLIDDVFKLAYNELEENSQKIYSQIASEKLSTKKLEQLLAKAEETNPEVLHNVTYNLENVDRSQPVYRKYLQKKWESYALMVTMQRLEQLHVIPDTLPTLEPAVDVRIKFGHNSKGEFSDWVVPGAKLPAFAVEMPPTIEIQEFSIPEEHSGLYSVLLVNPDTPDLETNSFRTTLNYGLHNVPLTYTENTITPGKLLTNPQWIFKKYQPLLPEKNAPTQRACLWVFRQEKELSAVDFNSEDFDIRSFADTNNLTAVGAHVWRQDFDRSVNQVREKYGLPKGNVYHRVRGTTPLL
ncbi:CIC11C00000003486 [Sungouiella intermedia]|uniref:Large ribosomal subunit protein mL38 n=1 Tax=Sungouiella intermedia TaxID=45354 RepID=A0A1L0FZF5_9ASCO|nr:CIC11C00000003486 [[Candida] intermedia]